MIVDAKIAAERPAQLLQTLLERLDAGLRIRIVLGERHQHTDPPRPLRLLRPRRERPRSSCTAEQRDEVPPPDHSITSSASASRVCGAVRPSALAVLRLITNS